MGNYLTLSSTIGIPSFNVTPVMYAFACTSIALFIKYIIQECIMMVMGNSKETEPKTFDDIKKVSLDELPKEKTNKRALVERLRRVKKEDLECIIMFMFIVIPYLIYTEGFLTVTMSNPSNNNSSNISSSMPIAWSDLSIANSVAGCLMILAFFVLRMISLILTFLVSKTMAQNVMKIVTFVYLFIFSLFGLAMVFAFNYYSPLPRMV